MRHDQWLAVSALAVLGVAVCASQRNVTGAAPAGRWVVNAGLPTGPVTEEQVLRGRLLVIHHACAGGCHGPAGRGDNPEADGWLAGMRTPEQEFLMGPCATDPEAEPCFRTRPRNLTPDNLTGLGRFSERQIFNALRFGLRPGETLDVEITSTVPGQGNFPEQPKYLAPPMPWPAWRHMSDQELWDIVAYLKHGLKPVSNRVQDSEGPPDFWAEFYTEETIGAYPAPPFPTANERVPPDDRLDQVLHGRELVLHHACWGCHGGTPPEAERWLAGARSPEEAFRACSPTPAVEPCFGVLPRNLTPDSATGLGRFSERQIFNALRFGLRPGETPDVEITSRTPGVGNFPEQPRYLAPAMPWSSWRHMSDEELWAIAAYLKHAVRPVSNSVADSEGPDDFWALRASDEFAGPYPAPPFPTANERRPD